MLLLRVLCHVADGRRRRNGPAGVRDHLLRQRVFAEIGAQPVPRPLVLRLFLAPDHFLRLRKLRERRREVRMRERILLLDADDGDVADLVFAPVRDELVIDLAAAGDDALHVLRGKRLDFADHVLELAVRHLLERGHGLLVAKQALRAHHDQRPAEVPEHLPAQQVIDLRGRRRHADLHVVLGTELQIALGPRGRMLGALPFVAMREQHDEAADAAPFRFAGRDELIDDDLGAVGEVAELRLPDDEPLRIGRRVAVLERQHRILGQHGIDDLERPLIVLHMLQRNPRSGIPLFPILVVQHGVPVREGAAPDVLARDPHAIAVVEERRIGKCFGHSPIERKLSFTHGLAVVDDLLHA